MAQILVQLFIVNPFAGIARRSRFQHVEISRNLYRSKRETQNSAHTTKKSEEIKTPHKKVQKIETVLLVM